MKHSNFLDEIKWNADGLVVAIAQDAVSGEILMQAWMNQESLFKTLEQGYAVYWSRSRGQLWRKGESSGNTQLIKGIFLDCDGDSLLLKVEQQGGIACHTGRRSCFYKRLDNQQWHIISDVIKDPKEMYS